MYAILKLVNLYFWKSFFGPFFAFVFPLIFVALLGNLLGYDQLFGGSLAITSMSICLTAMPQAIFEFKRSSLLKRIGVTPIKPWMFLAISAGFYLGIMLISSLWVLAVGILIFIPNLDVGREIQKIPGISADGKEVFLYSASLKNILDNVNWFGFLWGLIMNIIIGLSLGFLIVSTTKSTMAIQAIGISILIWSQFLAAQVLPLPMIQSSNFMKYASYISPFKYSTGLMIESFNGVINPNPEFLPVPGTLASSDVHMQNMGISNIFDINSNFEMLEFKGTKLMVMFNKSDKIANLVMPFVFTSIFSAISIKTFKWSAR